MNFRTSALIIFQIGISLFTTVAVNGTPISAQTVNNYAASAIRQPQKPAAAQTINQNEQTLYVRDAQEFRSERLKQVPELPDLPRFSGQAELLVCNMYPNLKGSYLASIHYATKSKTPDIMSWYASALPGAGWKLTSQYKPDLAAYSGPHGQRLQLSCTPPCKDGDGCTFSVLYHAAR